MRLEAVMSRSVRKITVQESAEAAWKLMQRERLHHLVVFEGNEVVGVLSERDLGGKHGDALRRNRVVSDLMTPHPITAEPTTPLKDAINMLRGYVIGCVPVLEKGKLVGIVTASDLLELLGKGLDRTALLPERRPIRDVPPYLKSGGPPIT